MTDQNKDVATDVEVQAETVEETTDVETEVSEAAVAAADEVSAGADVESTPAVALDEAYAPKASDGQSV